MAEWVQSGYEGMWRLTGGEGGQEYSGYVVRTRGGDGGVPEVWFAYEWAPTLGSHGENVWVASAPTREAAQSAVKGEFLCEVFMGEDTQAHCPFPGSVVRHKMYRGKLLRTVLCGQHSGIFADWDTLPLRNYRRTHGLLPDGPIIGDRITPKPEITCFQDAAKNAVTTAERNMWVAMQRAAVALAGFRYWSGVAAAYPTERHALKFREKRTGWELAKDHAAGMYATHIREDHEDHADLKVPEYFWHSVTCKAAEIVRSRKR